MAFWKGRSKFQSVAQKRRGLRKTGRLGGSRRSGFKARMVSPFAPTQTMLPRTLYPCLPAEMRVSMTLADTITSGVSNTAFALIKNSLISPNQGGSWPAGFPQMMRLYSRAVVDRVQVRQDFNTYFAGTQADQDYGPVDVVAAVLPATDIPGVSDFSSWYRMQSLPESKTLILSHPFAETGKSMFFSLDVRKLLAGPRDESYAVTSDKDGTITAPSTTAADSPFLVTYFGTHSAASGPTRYILTARSFTFHITFSVRHLSTAVAPG